MSEEKKKYRFETATIHGGYYKPEGTTLSRAVPIYATTSYLFNDEKHAADLFALKQFGNIYTRIMNPTNDVLEQRIAELEHGVAALAVSSGQSAELIAILTLLKQGDEILSSSEIYGGTHTLFSHTLARLGIKTNFVNPNDPQNFKKALTPNTKIVYLETLGNPNLFVPDLEEIVKIAHEFKIPVIVDNTVASPFLCNPIDFGADIVIHSTTKYITGHGNAIGGIIVDSGKFDWVASGKFNDLVHPDPSYHGLKFVESFGQLAYILKARVTLLRDFGCAASPFNSWTTLVGLETLPIRMERHCENAQKIAEYLKSHPKVAWVNYPGLREGNQKDLLEKYLPKGYSGLLGFGLKSGFEGAKKLINNVKLISHLANIGDAKSLIIHPASTTHQQLTEEEQKAAGISSDFIRFSVGIEHVDDIIEDLADALDKL